MLIFKSFQSKSGVGFLIRRILDYGQRPLVDLQKTPPLNFQFFWPGFLSFGHRF